MSGKIDLVEEIVALEIFYCGPLVGLLLENARHKHFEVVGGIDILGEGERAVLDLFVRILDILRFERRPPINQCIDNYSEAPNVNFVAMPLRLQYLRRDIVGSSTNGFLFLPIEINLGRQSEIPNFDAHIFIEKEVAQLEVSMYDLLGMQIL